MKLVAKFVQKRNLPPSTSCTIRHERVLTSIFDQERKWRYGAILLLRVFVDLTEGSVFSTIQREKNG